MKTTTIKLWSGDFGSALAIILLATSALAQAPNGQSGPDSDKCCGDSISRAACPPVYPSPTS